MVYTSTSIYEVMARINRNTRSQDSSFLEDFKEWIPEAMGMMRVKVATNLRWHDTKIRFHKGKLPCGLLSVAAVQYGQCRLRWYNGSIAADSYRSKSKADSVYPGIPVQGEQVFGTHLVKREAVDDDIDVQFYETDIQSVEALAYSDQWYYTELDYINTSMCDACVRVHYRGIPVDDRGLPLIPDEENYKEALYYYVRAKMIGAGYEDKVFTEDKCMDRFESYAVKARSRITYRSVDQAETLVDNLSRLVMPTDMWSTFNNPSPETGYDLI